MTKTCMLCPPGFPPLTALWQAGFTVEIQSPMGCFTFQACSPVVVCGMCKDNVTLDIFGDDIQRMVWTMTFGHPDIADVSLRMDDISDGLWHDPATSTGQRVPV